MSKSVLIKNVTKNTLSNILSKMLSFIQSIAVANILGPAAQGIRNSISLLYEYGMNSHLGIIYQHNIERQLVEEKSQEISNRISNIVFTLLLFMTVIVLLLLSTLSYVTNYSLSTKLSIFIVSLIIPVALYDFFYRSINYSQGKIGLIARANIIQGIAVLLLSVILTYKVGIPGFFLGLLFSTLLSVLYLYYNTDYIPKIVIDYKYSIYMLKHGFLQFLLQLFYLLISSTDRLFIVIYMTSYDLGIYSLGLSLSGLIYFLMQILLMPLTPNIYKQVSEENYIKDYLTKINKVLLFLLYYVAVCIIILSPFIGLVMPEYSEGINLAQIIVFSTIFIPLLFTQYFLAKRMNYLILATSAIALIIGFILNYLAIKLNLGLLGISFATLVTLFTYGNTVNFLGYRDIFGNYYAAFKECIILTIPLFYSLFGYMLIYLLANFLLYNYLNYYLVKILQVILFTLWYLPILIRIEKEHKILGVIINNFTCV